MVAYTSAGACTSSLVGAGLGAAGGILTPSGHRTAGVSLVLLVAVAGLARELGWLGLPLLQMRRQTCGIWARTHRAPVAAAMWGLDIGLVFTTWLTFSGVWLLTAAVIASGSPAFGATVFLAFWLGAALSVWVAPAFLSSAQATPSLLSAVAHQHLLFQRAHAAGLALAVVLLAWMSFASIPL